ncbi:MAG: hypothetical protein JW795_05545 [Chitinivibrionales bacterium]|nr:hypothetical protein [Chitinivibrionales bacterium]
MENCNRSSSKKELVHTIVDLLASFFTDDSITLCVKENLTCYCAYASKNEGETRLRAIAFQREKKNVFSDCLNMDHCDRILHTLFSLPAIDMPLVRTASGTVWTNQYAELCTKLSAFSPSEQKSLPEELVYKTFIGVPLQMNSTRIGFLLVKNREEKPFFENEIELMEKTAVLLESIFLCQRQRIDLTERIKEISCLQTISQIINSSNNSTVTDILLKIIDVLPQAWQYPEHTAVRLLFDGQEFTSQKYSASSLLQSADIVVKNVVRGRIEIVYTGPMTTLGKDIFLPEEEHLLFVIARQVELIIDGFEDEKEKVDLQKQLQHADRLATIGQLAAGVAHELNEPLNNIIGLCQLMDAVSDAPASIHEDVKEVMSLSLHIREIIKKLLFFSRQVPQKSSRTNLNNVVENGLYFLESRCVSIGIELRRSLAADMPEIIADTAQMHQMLVNIVVNSIQAMPSGGILTIKTCYDRQWVKLIVSDTGIGMSEEVKKQIFLPFFTTKGADKGTGLGLAVVHGIVASHRGTIDVVSQPGAGTTFEITLPLTPRQAQN